MVVNAVNLDWMNLPLANLLRDRYQRPVYVLNDSQAAAMGEYTFGEGNSSESSLVVINARHGIGAGIVINGRLFQGDGGGAGEIGHIVVVQEDGLMCRCGNRGCLETVASAQAIVNRARMLAGQSSGVNLPHSPNAVTLDAVEDAFNSGDPSIRQLIIEAGSYMGQVISDVIGILNIHKIVLSGDMTRFGETWLDAIKDTLSRTSFIGLSQDTRVELGQLGKNFIVLGASALILNNYSLLFNQQTESV